MANTWYVAANSGRVRFFAHENNAESWREVHELVDETAHLRVKDLIESDRVGPTAATQSVHNVGGALPNKTYEAAQTPDQHQAELFARKVTAYLLQAYQDKRFEQLVISSAPQFLGLLRQLLDPNVKQAIKLEVDKDYTQMSAGELQNQLQALQQTQ